MSTFRSPAKGSSDSSSNYRVQSISSPNRQSPKGLKKPALAGHDGPVVLKGKRKQSPCFDPNLDHEVCSRPEPVDYAYGQKQPCSPKQAYQRQPSEPRQVVTTAKQQANALEFREDFYQMDMVAGLPLRSEPKTEQKEAVVEPNNEGLLYPTSAPAVRPEYGLQADPALLQQVPAGFFSATSGDPGCQLPRPSETNPMNLIEDCTRPVYRAAAADPEEKGTKPEDYRHLSEDPSRSIKKVRQVYQTEKIKATTEAMPKEVFYTQQMETDYFDHVQVLPLKQAQQGPTDEESEALQFMVENPSQFGIPENSQIRTRSNKSSSKVNAAGSRDNNDQRIQDRPSSTMKPLVQDQSLCNINLPSSNPQRNRENHAVFPAEQPQQLGLNSGFTQPTRVPALGSSSPKTVPKMTSPRRSNSPRSPESRASPRSNRVDAPRENYRPEQSPGTRMKVHQIPSLQAIFASAKKISRGPKSPRSPRSPGNQMTPRTPMNVQRPGSPSSPRSQMKTVQVPIPFRRQEHNRSPNKHLERLENSFQVIGLKHSGRPVSSARKSPPGGSRRGQDKPKLFMKRGGQGTKYEHDQWIKY